MAYALGGRRRCAAAACVLVWARAGGTANGVATTMQRPAGRDGSQHRHRPAAGSPFARCCFGIGLFFAGAGLALAADTATTQLLPAAPCSAMMGRGQIRASFALLSSPTRVAGLPVQWQNDAGVGIRQIPRFWQFLLYVTKPSVISGCHNKIPPSGCGSDAIARINFDPCVTTLHTVETAVLLACPLWWHILAVAPHHRAPCTVIHILRPSSAPGRSSLSRLCFALFHRSRLITHAAASLMA